MAGRIKTSELKTLNPALLAKINKALLEQDKQSGQLLDTVVDLTENRNRSNNHPHAAGRMPNQAFFTAIAVLSILIGLLYVATSTQLHP